MSRFKFVWPLLLVGLAALVAVPAALGAKPDLFHARFVEDFEAELCGIPVDGHEVSVFTSQAFFDREGNLTRFVSTGSLMVTFTNAEGDSVILQASGKFQDNADAIVDEEAGTVTFTYSYRGLPEKLQTAQGPVLLRDAGFIMFRDTFDLETGDPISSEILFNKGPHPEAESDFALFCEVITEALG